MGLHRSARWLDCNGWGPVAAHGLCPGKKRAGPSGFVQQRPLRGHRGLGNFPSLQFLREIPSNEFESARYGGPFFNLALLNRKMGPSGFEPEIFAV